jgi:choline-sulfatase
VPDHPNVLFLLSDQHGDRYLGHRDDGAPVETPTLDRLARNGATFESAYCQMPVCGPSRMCLLSGQRAANCGGWTNGSVLDPEVPTLPEVFSRAGYRTCLQGKMHFGGTHQYYGFDERPYGDLTGHSGHQNDPPTGARAQHHHGLRDAGITEMPESILQERCVIQETLSFLREHRHERPDQPWFCCASFSRPHTPFTAPRRHYDRYAGEVPEPTVSAKEAETTHPFAQAWLDAHEPTYEVDVDAEERQHARAAYFACVSFLDEILGDMFATLEREGFLENTIVVYTSDHGEMAGEHGQWFKHTWHDPATRVPLIVQTPAHRRGERPASRIETPVGLIDCFPTLGSLADVPTPETVDGTDLSTVVETGSEFDRGPVVCDSLDEIGGEPTEFRVLRDGSYKYIHFRSYPDRCFDLSRDPHETTDIASEPPADHAAAVDRLRERASRVDFEAVVERRDRDRERQAENPLALPERFQHRLNAYVFPDGRVVEADTPLSAPRTIADSAEEFFADGPATDRS